MVHCAVPGMQETRLNELEQEVRELKKMVAQLSYTVEALDEASISLTEKYADLKEKVKALTEENENSKIIIKSGTSIVVQRAQILNEELRKKEKGGSILTSEAKQILGIKHNSSVRRAMEKAKQIYSDLECEIASGGECSLSWPLVSKQEREKAAKEFHERWGSQ